MASLTYQFLGGADEYYTLGELEELVGESRAMEIAQDLLKAGYSYSEYLLNDDGPEEIKKFILNSRSELQVEVNERLGRIKREGDVIRRLDDNGEYRTILMARSEAGEVFGFNFKDSMLDAIAELLDQSLRDGDL